MGKIVICGSCGAEFDDDLAKCPYCGSVNLKGAEKEYMEKLEKFREDMGGLDDVPLKELKDAFQKQGKRLRKVVLTILALAAAVLLVFFFVNRRDEKDYRDQYLWEQENFPILNALYDAGEYDEMLEVLSRLMADEDHDVYGWEHFSFYLAYDSAVDFQRLYAQRETGDLNNFGQKALLYNEWYLVCLKEFADELAAQQEALSKQEMKVLAPYIETAAQDLLEGWGMSQQEYDEFLKQAAENFYHVSFTQCEEYIDNMAKGEKQR